MDCCRPFLDATSFFAVALVFGGGIEGLLTGARLCLPEVELLPTIEARGFEEAETADVFEPVGDTTEARRAAAPADSGGGFELV